MDAPLVIDFAAGSRVERDAAVAFVQPALAIVQNGPPGTRVVFRDGAAVPLPTDQIVFADACDGFARVGFGGMRYDGVVNDVLVFVRVRDLAPAELLSPERGLRMTLWPWMVAVVRVDGRPVWSAA